MDKRFKILGVISILFKVLSFGTLILLLIALIRLAIGPRQENLPVPLSTLVFNLAFTMSILALIFYALGDIIRVLRVIEEQTRKS